MALIRCSVINTVSNYSASGTSITLSDVGASAGDFVALFVRWSGIGTAALTSYATDQNESFTMYDALAIDTTVNVARNGHLTPTSAISTITLGFSGAVTDVTAIAVVFRAASGYSWSTLSSIGQATNIATTSLASGTVTTSDAALFLGSFSLYEGSTTFSSELIGASSLDGSLSAGSVHLRIGYAELDTAQTSIAYTATNSWDNYTVSQLFAVNLVASGSTHTVTYHDTNADEGSAPVDSTAYDSGDTATAKANIGALNRHGYYLSGWNTASDGSGTGYAFLGSIIVTADVDLYPVWTAISGAVVSMVTSQTAFAAIIKAAAATSYGWYVDGTLTDSSLTPSLTLDGSEHSVELRVEAASALTHLNLGYDGSDEGPDDIFDDLASAGITNLTGLNSATSLSEISLLQNTIPTLDVSSCPITYLEAYYADIDTLDYGSNTTMIRLCIEGCDLQCSMDLSVFASTLQDLRGSVNPDVLSYGGWTFPESFPALWHFCFRENGLTSFPDVEMPVVRQYYVAQSTGLTGYLTITSTVFQGLWIRQTGVNGVTIPSTNALNDIDARDAALTLASIDALLLACVQGGISGGSFLATGDNNSGPSAVGAANAALLVADGWTVTLNATVTTYNVTYNGNGSDEGSVPVDSTEYVDGDTVTVLGNTGSLARSGYSFVGWATIASSTSAEYVAGDTFEMGTSDVTLYAIWEASSLSVPSSRTIAASSNTYPEAFIQDPESSLDYAINWESLIASGDSLSSSTWSCDGMTVGAYATPISGYITQVWLSGGSDGNYYKLTNHIVTTLGREDDRIIDIMVEET